MDWIRLEGPLLKVYLNRVELEPVPFATTIMSGIENGARYIIRNVKGETVLDLNGSDGRTSKSFDRCAVVPVQGLIAPLGIF